ncbi:MAG: hypothetical protein CME19_00135 [Gemmatimonadetes bacterium]|nr:hypothetical protein [Gemmatimonadota bacterium]
MQEMSATEGIKAGYMQAAILAMVVVNIPLLLAVFVMGYGVHYGWWGLEVATHVKMGLVTTILTMLTHTTTMFYFMGTGSAIKEEVREEGLDLDYLRRARAFKGLFFYALFFGMLLIMAAAMLGGGAHSDLLRPVQEAGQSFLSRIHELLALLSLVINLYALVITPVYISRNNILLDEVMGADAKKAPVQMETSGG